jgi:hypothetical protein
MDEPRSAPWQLTDVLSWGLTVGLGAGAIVASWLGSSDSVKLSTQYGWTSLAVVGVIVIGGANCLWLFSGRRAIGERRDALMRAARFRRSPAPPTTGAARRFVAAPEMTRYHQPDCPVVVGKDVVAMSASAHRRAGREPCRMCEP